MVEIEIENNPLEFEYISSEDKMDLEESQSDHEGHVKESEDEANAWIWKSSSLK